MAVSPSVATKCLYFEVRNLHEMEVQRREFLVGLTAALSGCVSDSQPRSRGDVTDGGVDEDTLYHVSTVDALRCGHLSDEKTIDELVENGDWGLGTVNGVDGELAVVDGEAYAVRGDGTADKLDGTTKTPFAAVTEFEPDDTVEIEEIGGFEDFAESVTEELPRTDYFYALRVQGTFDFLRTRSVDRQVEPYPTLEEVIENETVFEFEDVPVRHDRKKQLLVLVMPHLHRARPLAQLVYPSSPHLGAFVFFNLTPLVVEIHVTILVRRLSLPSKSRELFIDLLFLIREKRLQSGKIHPW